MLKNVKKVPTVTRYKNYPNLIVMIDEKTKKPYAVNSSEKSNLFTFTMEVYNFMMEQHLENLVVRIASSKIFLASAEMSYFEMVEKMFYLMEYYPAELKNLFATEIGVKNFDIPANAVDNPILAYYFKKMFTVYTNLEDFELDPIFSNEKIIQPSSSAEFNNLYAEYVQEYNKALEARRTDNQDYLEYMLNFENILRKKRRMELLSKFPALKESCLVLSEHLQDALKEEKDEYNLGVLETLNDFINSELIEEDDEKEIIN